MFDTCMRCKSEITSLLEGEVGVGDTKTFANCQEDEFASITLSETAVFTSASRCHDLFFFFFSFFIHHLCDAEKCPRSECLFSKECV